MADASWAPTITLLKGKELACLVFKHFVSFGLIKKAKWGRIFMFEFPCNQYQLTPKGVNILLRFCQGRGVKALVPGGWFNLFYNPEQLFNLDRETNNDPAGCDRMAVDVAFRRFIEQMGVESSNNVLRPHQSAADNNSTSSARWNIKIQSTEIYSHTFTGKKVLHWLVGYSRSIEFHEACYIATMFLVFDFIMPTRRCRSLTEWDSLTFQPSKEAIYCLTDRGGCLLDEFHNVRPWPRNGDSFVT